MRDTHNDIKSWAKAFKGAEGKQVFINVTVRTSTVNNARLQTLADRMGLSKSALMTQLLERGAKQAQEAIDDDGVEVDPEPEPEPVKPQPKPKPAPKKAPEPVADDDDFDEDFVPDPNAPIKYPEWDKPTEWYMGTALDEVTLLRPKESRINDPTKYDRIRDDTRGSIYYSSKDWDEDGTMLNNGKKYE